MATKSTAKATLHQRAMHELKGFMVFAVYLYITLGAVVLMKTAVLHTEGIEFAFWGIAVVKAAVLAKFMLLGKAMKIGERATTSPLIWPTLHKAFERVAPGTNIQVRRGNSATKAVQPGCAFVNGKRVRN